MTAQLSFYEAPEPLDDLAAQMTRLPPEVRVWLDAMLERGAVLEFHGDTAVEAERLKQAATAGLNWQWAERHRGLRRMWMRPIAPADPTWAHLRGYMNLDYEPRLERELFQKAKDEPGRGQGRRTHWPKTLP